MTGYDSPAAWAAGPDRLYGELARVAVAGLPPPPPPAPAAVALDAGTGTGAFARALSTRGYRVIATDVSVAMLAYHHNDRGPAVAADIAAIPLPDRCVDAAVAGFVLSHIPDPVRGLTELVRVTRAGGTVLATSFLAEPGMPTYPAKGAVDTVLTAYGYEPPAWYVALKGPGEENVGSVPAFAAVATAAGLPQACIERVSVDVGELGTGALVAWRLGMAHIAPWLATLDPQRRAELTADALTELDRVVLTPLPMLVLRATLDDHRTDK
jgi:SAM-dependent methyltransferase